MRVACIGECMLELVLPPPASDAARLGTAGDTLNVAVYLRRAAEPQVSVAYVTVLGTDPVSDRMLDFLRGEDLETGLIERRPDRIPGLYAISTDAAGERSFTYWRNDSAARTLFLPPAEVTPGALAGFALIYLSGITLAVLAPEARAALAASLPRFRAGGGRVAFDSNYRPRLWPDAATARAEIAALWAMTDIALPSLDDEMVLFGDADEAAVIARLRAAGIRRGALKRGRHGPVPIDWDGPLPPFPEARHVVDTTAAGDSFNGAYLAALLGGATEDQCLAAGHAMASRVVGHPGAIIPR